MILFSFFTSCQRDDALTEPEKSFALKSTQRYVLSQQETSQAISLYNNQMNKVSNHSDFTFDGKDFVKLQDRYGKLQYTFMVKHVDDTNLKFHNVIITDWGGLKKTVLVSYEMSQTFADSFNTGRLGFDSFNGTITYTLLTADAGYPCGESPSLGIPMVGGSGPGNGGGGSAGGGGSGQPWNPNGNGNPYNQALVDAKFLMMEIAYLSSQLAAPMYGHQSSRNIGSISSITAGPEPLIEIPTVSGTTNPCGDGEDQLILFPIDISLLFHINFTPELEADFKCQTEIMRDAIYNCSELSGDFLNIFQGSDNYHITYKSSNQFVDNNAASTHFLSSVTTEDGQNLELEIVFNDYALNNSTDLYLVNTVMHENIHAILLFLVYSQAIPIMDENPTYTQLLNAYIDYLIDNGYLVNNNEAHHNFMVQFVSNIAESVKSYGLDKGYNLPDSFYNALAWSGLTETTVFNNLYPENDTQGNPNADFMYIIGTQMTEYHNDTFMDSNGNQITDQNGNPIFPQGAACTN